MKKILILGASGMIGSELLQFCLDSDEVGKVISITRKKSDISHKKYSEIVRSNFLNYSDIADQLTDLLEQ